MKAASIQEIKAELQASNLVKLRELCLQLAKFKKENKELLTYLLFESHDQESYIAEVKEEINEGFVELPKANIYLTKKSLRKILRIAGKHIKYVGSKQGEAQVLLHFCQKLKASGIAYHKYPVLNNLYQMQLKKVNKAIDGMHEDEQYDYVKEMAAL